MMDWRKTAGFRCGVIIGESGKTQKDFAKLIDMTPSNLSKAVKGLINPISVCECISKLYKIPMEYFFLSDDREAEYLLHPEKRIEEEKELHPTWEQFNEKVEEVKALKEELSAAEGRIERAIEYGKNKTIEVDNITAEMEALKKKQVVVVNSSEKPDVRPIIKAMLKAIEDLAEVI